MMPRFVPLPKSLEGRVFAAVILALVLLGLGLLHAEERKTSRWVYLEATKTKAPRVFGGLPWPWLSWTSRHEYPEELSRRGFQFFSPAYYTDYYMEDPGLSVNFLNLVYSFYTILALEGLAILSIRLLRKELSRVHLRFNPLRFLAAGLCGAATPLVGSWADDPIVAILAYTLLAPPVVCLAVTWCYRGYVAPVLACVLFWTAAVAASAAATDQTAGFLAYRLSAVGITFAVHAAVVIIFEFFRLDFSWSGRRSQPPGEAVDSQADLEESCS